MKTRTMTALRQVRIDISGKHTVAWEPKEPTLRSLGRWTDPKALLRRMYELEHPEANVPEGPGRQWQATWRGRVSPGRRDKAHSAA